MMIQNWLTITIESLQDLLQGFINFFPKMVGALLILVIGWFISIWIGKFIAEILKKIKVDRIFENAKWEEALKGAELKIKVSDFIGGIVKWVLAIVFLSITVEILELDAFAKFLQAIVAWLPNLIVATAIFVVAVIVADFAEKFIKAVVNKMGVSCANVLGIIVRWAVWIFAILAILSQLGVAREIIQILVSGFVALIVISAGIAFGLGGKDIAKETLEELKTKLKG
ncbi:hypothetical protein COY61_01495 [bacterium (Candidatus Gribaldobacteria) CG_4_10_14_0_8_um_filter_33_9]|uniref:Small-conductance mechanosensitive ion channel n=1 Tax=bacterium (Candidatus Gribaldobacteria) CG_4_10_14_0_8_um_filter_33_9 TaxID=2014266 RepID=A0A2M7RMW1_9BACT|nr:MAG: hypothetical protein COY61_01495 [bacterium (Candidatus Gribaldobacteria) CG_4_10_14_0_8_um_filter_33_9]